MGVYYEYFVVTTVCVCVCVCVFLEWMAVRALIFATLTCIVLLLSLNCFVIFRTLFYLMYVSFSMTFFDFADSDGFSYFFVVFFLYCCVGIVI